MITLPSSSRILLAAACVSLAACATAVPPSELVDARSAYILAEEGPAQQFAPAKLDTAKKALTEAEKAFEEDPESEKTKALAYVAERRARISASAGELEKLKKKRATLDAEYVDLEHKRATMTKEELAATRARLDLAEGKAAAAEGKAAATATELAAKRAELEKEKAAREAAEGKLTAALASLKEMASVKEEARGMVITLNGAVLFATAKSELLPIAKTKLDEVAAALKAQGFKKIVIEGHTDSRGTVADNERLSLARATSVKTHLVSQGLDSAKIDAQGLASTRPVATNDTVEGRADNRRVELIVTPEK